jgi:hypothetical protein
MSQPLLSIIDKKTKRQRKVNNTIIQEVIKSKLSGVSKDNFKVIYEDSDAEKLKEFRSKLLDNDSYGYMIKHNKIIQIRKKQKKIDVIKSTIAYTIDILKSYNYISDCDKEELNKFVFNDLLNGSNKLTFKIKI